MSAAVVDWTPERIETLRLGVAEGLSFSQVARRVGSGCTRCAAIGKANRMGFNQPARASQPRRVAPANHRPAAPRRMSASAPTPFERSAPPLSGEPRPARVVIPFREEGPGLRTVLTVGAQECRWPLGSIDTGDFTFCGQHAPGGPYCPGHAKRAVAAVQPTAKPRPYAVRGG